MDEDEAVLIHFGVKGMHWGQRKKAVDPVRKIPTRKLDRRNPEHAKEYNRRENRNRLIGLGISGGYLAYRLVEHKYAMKLLQNARHVPVSKIPQSRALSDGKTFVLRTLANGNWG